MAKTVIHTAHVGQIVYKAYEPLNPGKILSMHKGPSIQEYGHGRHPIVNLCIVHFINGKSETIERDHLNDFAALVEDHARKLDKHAAALVKAAAL